MKTIAIIAELNPCHKGHAYFLKEARAASGADRVIVLLSGDFVQRGEPAIFDKYVRTRMALDIGADLVLELPVVCACGSAPRFAEGAVRILDALGCVDELWFGSECGNIAPFLSMSETLRREEDNYKEALKKYLSSGSTFPDAREKALRETSCVSEEELSLLRAPNNTLGLAYVRALREIGSSIVPKTLPRVGSEHEDGALSEGGYGPASAIRSVLRADLEYEHRISQIRSHIPSSQFSFYTIHATPPTNPSLFSRQDIETTSVHCNDDIHDAPLNACCNDGFKETLLSPICADDFSDMLLYALRNETVEQLTSYLDVAPDLARRIMDLLPQFTTFESFAELVKTRDRTLAQVRRALLHILLRIRSTDAEEFAQKPFSRILGHAHADDLISAIHKKGRLPLFTKGADLIDHAYRRDLFASNLYEAVVSRRSARAAHDECQRFMITTTQP